MTNHPDAPPQFANWAWKAQSVPNRGYGPCTIVCKANKAAFIKTAPAPLDGSRSAHHLQSLLCGITERTCATLLSFPFLTPALVVSTPHEQVLCFLLALLCSSAYPRLNVLGLARITYLQIFE